MDTSIDENDSELEKCRSSTGKFTSLSTIEAELFHHNVRDNIATTTTTRRRSVSNDSETRANDRKSEEAFLKANYKYKRRASWVLSGANCYLLAASGIVKYLRKVQRYVRCVKMLNNCPIVLLMAIIMSLGFTDMTEAGACWVERMDNGKCKELYSKNVSREECCGRGYEFAFTEKDMSDAEYFFTAAIGGGTNCVSCLDSCDVAKCGPGKRCVIRKGRPKCICAPICKASKEKKLKKNPIRVIAGNDKITDINFGIPLNREIRSLSELGQSQHEIETDSTALAELKKNQRKSNTTKRRKHKANRTNHENVESIQLPRKSKPRAKLKSDRFVVTAGNGEHNLGKLENSVKRKKKNNPSSKNVVIVQNSPNVDQSQQHHSRHQYKKHRKGNKDQKVNGQNTTISNRRPHRPSQPNQSTNVALDEKIRGGFFNHGFPYPPNDLTQMVHGRYFNPVCGTDGKTYKTECQLKKRACRREATSLTVAYRGYCQTSCKSVQCLRGLSCVEDQYGIPHCIACTITCPQDDLSPVIDPAKAVCGVDGRTYKSVCDINRMICTTSRSIAVAYNGPCQDEANCNTIHCGDRKICLTDLVTHKPRCVSCSFKCPRKRRPQGQRYEDVKICGNNNHTYHSWCQMRRDSCNTEFYIDVKHVGACHKDSFSTGIMDFH